MTMTRLLRLVRGGKYDGRSMSDLNMLNYDESVQLASQITVPAASAAICAYDHVFDYTMNRECPKCGSAAWLKLTDLGVNPVNEAAFQLVPVLVPRVTASGE